MKMMKARGNRGGQDEQMGFESSLRSLEVTSTRGGGGGLNIITLQ